jgi:hypothetical protein
MSSRSRRRGRRCQKPAREYDATKDRDDPASTNRAERSLPRLAEHNAGTIDPKRFAHLRQTGWAHLTALAGRFVRDLRRYATSATFGHTSRCQNRTCGSAGTASSRGPRRPIERNRLDAVFLIYGPRGGRALSRRTLQLASSGGPREECSTWRSREGNETVYGQCRLRQHDQDRSRVYE